MARFDESTPERKKELWATLALRNTSGIGARRARTLVATYGSVLAAAEAGLRFPKDWKDKAGIAENLACEFASGRWRVAAKREWDAIQYSGAQFLICDDPAYPAILWTIPDPPLLIYYKGNPDLLCGAAVAVVGSRRCTREGVLVTAFLARNLSKAGVAIVSGMAKGIDRAAHRAGLEGPGRSVAVLATGIDIAYPDCNADLYKALEEHGVLVTEYAPGTPPVAAHFSVRNRLISGLSQGVLVIEAAGRSGSLITARLALEQNRDVFAVPGHTMSAQSEGCRELIRNGARPVFSADDVLQDLAPLLSLEARKALEGRLRLDAARPRQAPGVSLSDAAYDEALASAETLIPQDGLPWTTPHCASARKEHPEHTQAESISNVRPKSIVTPCPFPVVPAHLRDDPHISHIFTALQGRTLHIDTLCRNLEVDVAVLSSLLLQLELAGCVRLAPGMLYSLPEN